MTKEEPSSISASELTWALAALVAFLVAFDAAGGWMLRRAYESSTANPIVYALASNPDTVIFGSSTAKTALDPSALGARVFNAAENGQTLFYATAFLRNLPDNSRLRRIIFGLDLEDFARGYDSELLIYLKRLTPLATRDDILLGQLHHVDPFIRIKHLSGLYPFQGQVRNVIREWLFPVAPGNGYLPLPENAEAARRPPVHAAEAIAAPPESLAAFDEFVAQVDRRNAQLVLFSPPWNGEPNFARQPRYADLMREIRARAGGESTCDLTSVTPSSVIEIAEDSTNFADRQHLHAKGAKKYSKVFARLLGEHCDSAKPFKMK